MTIRVRIDAAAKMPRQHLAAETDAEIRLVFLQRHADPVDLALDEIDIVIGALRAAENHRAGMLGHRVGQRIAQRRTADIERDAALAEEVADAAGRRILLMQNDKNGQ